MAFLAVCWALVIYDKVTPSKNLEYLCYNYSEAGSRREMEEKRGRGGRGGEGIRVVVRYTQLYAPRY